MGLAAWNKTYDDDDDMHETSVYTHTESLGGSIKHGQNMFDSIAYNNPTLMIRSKSTAVDSSSKTQ